MTAIKIFWPCVAVSPLPTLSTMLKIDIVWGGGGRRWAREVVFASLASGTDAKVPKAPKVQICFKTFVHDCSLLEPYWPSVVFVGPHCDWSVLP